MIESNKRNDREISVAKTLENIEVFKFFFKVNHETNKIGLAIHAKPAPENIAAQPSKKDIIESPQVEVVQ